MFGEKSGDTKYAIKAQLQKNVKIASNHSAKKMFNDLYKKDKNFRDQYHRLTNYYSTIVNSYKSRGATEYDIFNSVILPMSDNDSTRMSEYFYDKLKAAGYSGVKDVNDIKFSNLRGHSPTILFDLGSFKQTAAEKLTDTEIAKGKKYGDKLPNLYKALYDPLLMSEGIAYGAVIGATFGISANESVQARYNQKQVAAQKKKNKDKTKNKSKRGA